MVGRRGAEEEEKEDEEVKRKPWSCGCSAATAEVKVVVESGRASGFDPTADINIYVFLTFSSVYCGCTIFPDGLQWPLSVIQSPEKILFFKKKKRKKQTKQTREVMSLSIGGEEGSLTEESCLVAACETQRCCFSYCRFVQM